MSSNGSNERFAAALEHHRAGRLDEAVSLYLLVLADEPNHADVLHLLGVIDYQQGDDDEAETRIRRAIELRGDAAVYHSNLGNVLRRRGRRPQAVECYRRAVDLKPDFTDAHNNLGTVLFETGRIGEAQQCYERVIELQPGHVDALCNLGHLLREQGQAEPSRILYARALSHSPRHAAALVGLGVIEREAGAPDAAEAHFRSALAADANQAEALNGLGNCRRDRDRLDEAVAFYRQAVALRPDYCEAHCNLGRACQALGRMDEAESWLRRAIELGPDQPEIQAALALFLLQAGRLDEGWPLYEARWRNKGVQDRVPGLPAWDGGDLAGRTILLHGEQGLGDNIQFIRYAPLVKARVGRVVLRVPAPVRGLFVEADGIDLLLGDGESLPDIHCRAGLLSLPGILGTTLETIPGRVPYLRPDPAKAESWRQRLAALAAPRIGIVWRGNPAHLNDRNRSLSAEVFSRLLPPGHAVVSLQKEATAAEISILSAERRVMDAGPDLGDLTDTAALINGLDLVVSVDTAICHLAGALAVPVWTLLPFSPDWRWLLGRGDSPWYPTMRLFRQETPGDWEVVLDTVKAELVARTGGPGNPRRT